MHVQFYHSEVVNPNHSFKSFFLFSVDYSVTKKSFHFAKKYNMPFYFVSASDGTNVVKVSEMVRP